MAVISGIEIGFFKRPDLFYDRLKNFLNRSVGQRPMVVLDQSLDHRLFPFWNVNGLIVRFLQSADFQGCLRSPVQQLQNLAIDLIDGISKSVQRIFVLGRHGFAWGSLDDCF